MVCTHIVYVYNRIVVFVNLKPCSSSRVRVGGQFCVIAFEISIFLRKFDQKKGLAALRDGGTRHAYNSMTQLNVYNTLG